MGSESNVAAREYTFTREPEGVVYRALLDHAASVCTEGLLVVRDGQVLSSAGLELLEELGPFLVSRESASEWPGTRLFAGRATLHRFPLSRAVVALLQRASTRLFAWEVPALPEDLCLFRADGRLWLATIAHERDGWLMLGDDEHTALLRTVPELTSHVLRRD